MTNKSVDAPYPAADQRGSYEGLDSLLAILTLEEKVLLLTGRDFWTTWPMPKIGLRRLLVSDGPSGVRGEVWDERSPSLSLPSATTLSSAWDLDIARRYGAAAAVEARRKDVDVVLGPTINLHRSPRGGRHFEAFSEDPVLTADLAASYVAGMQANGVGATPKHYIANDSENDRFTVNTVVSDRALRELYLLAFEKAIVESHAWLVMSSYNSINGVTATENELLETPLNSEWGFDGVVISDWTAVRSVNSATASQDLVMPGPAGPWGDALVAAVQSGSVDEASVDRKVLRLLQLAARVGALEGFEPAVSEPALVEDGIAFVREAAAAGSVLLTNRGELPWDARALTSVAVIGHNAKFARSQGGGSATVMPEYVVSPLQGIRTALGDTPVSYSIGAVVQEGVAALPIELLRVPGTDRPGILTRFVSGDGTELLSEERLSTALVWFGGTAPIIESSLLELTTVYTPDETGVIRLGFAAVGTGRVYVNDALVVDETVRAEGNDLGAAFLAPPTAAAPVSVTAGVSVDIRIEYVITNDGALSGALSFAFGIEPDDDDPDALIAEAVAAARAAEVAVVVVGTNSKVESEGYDRSSLALPGNQDALVRAVAEANPRTIVIVNAGSPVLMPWQGDVAAVLVGYFGGQEFGNAVADIVFGLVEPGGRLPTTWPETEADVPVWSTDPIEGELRYDEGIHIGYRAWLKAETAPAFEFGHGLGYTTFETSDVSTSGSVEPDGEATVTLTVSNTGQRAGKHVVQVYAERADSVVDRPVRWLVGFAPVWVEAGQSAEVTVTIPSRLLAYWNDGWQYEEGTFVLYVGTSVTTLPHAASLLLTTETEVAA